MKRTSLFRILLTLLVIACASPASAAADRAGTRNLSEHEINQRTHTDTVALRQQTDALILASAKLRIQILNQWREALDQILDQELEHLIYLSGGGSAYVHGMARNNHNIEVFLARHAFILTDLLDPDPDDALPNSHPLMDLWHKAMQQHYASFNFDPNDPDEAWKEGWKAEGIAERFPFEFPNLIRLYDRLPSESAKTAVLQFIRNH